MRTGRRVGRICARRRPGTKSDQPRPHPSRYATTGRPVFNQPGPAPDPSIPSGTSMICVNPASVRRWLNLRDRTPRAQISATGAARSPPVTSNRACVKSSRRISMAWAPAPTPVRSHSSGLRISTRINVPAVAPACASVTVTLPAPAASAVTLYQFAAKTAPPTISAPAPNPNARRVRDIPACATNRSFRCVSSTNLRVQGRVASQFQVTYSAVSVTSISVAVADPCPALLPHPLAGCRT